MDTFSFSESVAVRFPFSGVCDWCKESAQESRGGKLKKCTGCSVVRYCGKECQVAAWPTHKYMCRLKSKDDAAQLGYPSAASIASALRYWATIHMWSLRTITETNAHGRAGVDWYLKNQHAMVFVLSPRNPDAADPDNPAKAFQLEEGGMVRKDDRDFLRSQWDLIEKTCKTLTDSMRAKLATEAERQAFAVFLPAAFHFKTTGLVSFHQYPIYRLREHGAGPSYEHAHNEENCHCRLLDDIAQMCVESINCGVVLRARGGDDNQPLPNVCFHSRTKKSWECRRLNWEWDKVGVHAPSHFRSGLYPAEIYRRYHQLLPHRTYK
ncbi:hypothetical protein BD309DRAFT_959826 [Dichomitus squalens]|uniref:MYND-type domain-containing protein n=1 Tax=Dichomitus squalens TaxID=114155 RepID=A0A4V2K4A8_9APHY|nr:hypothetical protein BD311DRAFT_535862 [Dichomitus squalens]TBU43793.1 hypothetical protein BD309DRAFT_959826 [Dichomitus squalens]TBU57070.1 hypothetical protein BD310DRAFT_930277 [Dichomitus squalens]